MREGIRPPNIRIVLANATEPTEVAQKSRAKKKDLEGLSF